MSYELYGTIQCQLTALNSETLLLQLQLTSCSISLNRLQKLRMV